MRISRAVFSLCICAVAFASIAAQAVGIDIGSFVHTHAEAFAGLSMVALIGEVSPTDIKDALNRISGEMKSAVTPLKEKNEEIELRLHDLEQRGARPGGPVHTDSGPSVSSLVTGDEGFKMVQSGRMKSTQIRISPAAMHGKAAALTSTTLSAALTAQRLPGIVVSGLRKLTIRDLIPNLRTTAGSLEYVRETSITNGAATVAEGALKPESTVAMELVTANVVTIATWVHASKQILADMPQLQNYLDNRLRYMVQYAEEGQLLNGSGSGNNLLGLYTAATAFAAPISLVAPNRMDVIRLAIGQLEDTNYNATGIVMHPDDWTAIDLLKNADGDYLKSDPSADNPRTLWGRPVVTTTAMSVDTFLVGDFTVAATLYDREDMVLDIATQDQDDFVRNLVKLRLEERVSLAVQLPGALVKGDLTPA